MKWLRYIIIYFALVVIVEGINFIIRFYLKSNSDWIITIIAFGGLSFIALQINDL